MFKLILLFILATGQGGTLTYKDSVTGKEWFSKEQCELLAKEHGPKAVSIIEEQGGMAFVECMDTKKLKELGLKGLDEA